MSKRPSNLLALLSVVLVISIAFWGGLTLGSHRSDASVRRDFMFEVDGYHTQNQGGQVLNLYIKYRYDDGLPDPASPDYTDLRREALGYLDGIDTSTNPYWEVLARELCTRLKSAHPIEAISCQLQVLPDNRAGLPYEPGYHGTTYTVGDIEPLAVPGPEVRP